MEVIENEMSKPKIALIVDVEGWAYYNIANQIKKNLSTYYDIDILSMDIFDSNIVKLMFILKDYDLIHFIWRSILATLEDNETKIYLQHLGVSYDEFVQIYLKDLNISISVYDHMILNKEVFSRTQCIFKYTKYYTVSSNKLNETYSNIEGIKKPNRVITDGVDLQKFCPTNLEKFNNIENRKLIIGWVGNSKAIDSENDDDIKGVRKIIIPCINELIEEGYPLEMKFADGSIEKIPHSEMPNYYNSIDLYICMSKHEGTPNPVLEAMASGIPVISTDVGIVPDAFGGKQKEFVLEERSKEQLRTKIINLIENKELFKILSKENLKQIKDWEWKKKCQEFKEYFDVCLNKE